ncbi:LysR family transcriptional regulator [Sphingomonas sp. LB3N6]|uniref:LysR family transcriptional regulator n=1 Tax=Sphingomonas fucosidasi TaxID=3096164 RepID=UPI002FC7B2A9
MMNLDLNLLRVIDAMFKENTVSGAAATLGMSQPGVSLALRRLRIYFGDELFIRQAGVMVPTAVAEQLRDPIGRAMVTIRTEVIPATPFVASSSDRCFVLSLSDLGDLSFLPDLVDRFRQIAPGTSVRSVAVDLPELVKGLADGTIDLALGHLIGFDSRNYFEQTLFEQPFVCLVRTTHPRIRDTLSLDQYLREEHAVVAQDGRSQDVFERRIGELGHHRRIVLHSPHFMSVPFLVAQSDMITVVPLAVARIYARLLQLKALPLPFDVPAVELKQFWHSRAHTNPASAWLRRQVANLFVGRDPTRNPNSRFWSNFLPRE